MMPSFLDLPEEHQYPLGGGDSSADPPSSSKKLLVKLRNVGLSITGCVIPLRRAKLQVSVRPASPMTASALFFAPFVSPFRFQIYCLALSFRNAEMSLYTYRQKNTYGPE